MPTPRIYFKLELKRSDTQFALLLNSFSDDVSILIKGESISGHIISCTVNNDLISVVWTPKIEPLELEISEYCSLHSIIFHLFN